MNANNMIMIHGRLTRDPELKTASTGSEYCNITVAVDSFNGKEKETDFFDCTAHPVYLINEKDIVLVEVGQYCRKVSGSADCRP